MNQAFFKRFMVDYGGVIQAELTDEFAGILSADLMRHFENEQAELVSAASGYHPSDYI